MNRNKVGFSKVFACIVLASLALCLMASCDSSRNHRDIQLPDTEQQQTSSESEKQEATSRDPIQAPAKPEPEYETVTVDDEVTNVLLLGVDTRGSSTKSRSDTMLLVSYNHDKNVIRLVSFMRDTWVEIPDSGWNRLNAANVFGGVDLLYETLEHNFGVSVDDYALTTFKNFRKIVDIIGGVDVELTQSEINYINRKLHSDDGDYDNDIVAEPGIVHLNGAQALWQVRDRSVGDADFSRTSRQRDFLEALVTQTFDNLDIGKVLQLIPAAFECIDTSLELDDILSIATSVLGKGMPTIETARVPFDGAWNYANINGASVLQVDIAENAAQLDTFLHDGWTHTEEVLKDQTNAGQLTE